jgi:hypothetical protein
MESKLEMKIEPIEQTDNVESLLQRIEFLTKENNRIFRKFKTEKRKNNRLRKKINGEKGLVDEWVSVDTDYPVWQKSC